MILPCLDAEFFFVLVLIAPYRDASLALSWCQFGPASVLLGFCAALVMILPCLRAELVLSWC
jgi:hypothetical protein